MKLYDVGMEPEPRRVRIFLAEKGVSVSIERADLEAFEHDSVGLAGDRLPRVPVLELDDGTVITESMAICRYFEGLRPEPPLFGRPGKEQALVEMWNRRVELNLFAAVADEADERVVVAFLALLDHELKDRLFIVSDHYTVADITALIALDRMNAASLAIPDDLVNVRRWYEQVSARPSASA